MEVSYHLECGNWSFIGLLQPLDELLDDLVYYELQN